MFDDAGKALTQASMSSESCKTVGDSCAAALACSCKLLQAEPACSATSVMPERRSADFGCRSPSMCESREITLRGLAVVFAAWKMHTVFRSCLGLPNRVPASQVKPGPLGNLGCFNWVHALDDFVQGTSSSEADGL